MTGQISEFGTWLQANDSTIDLITLWALALGFSLFGITKVISWLTLRNQGDATMVGVALKRQKVAEALIGFGMAFLYGMTLVEHYLSGSQFDFWDRLILRIVIAVVMIVGAYLCLKFTWHLKRETRSDLISPSSTGDDGEV